MLPKLKKLTSILLCFLLILQQTVLAGWDGSYLLLKDVFGLSIGRYSTEPGPGQR